MKKPKPTFTDSPGPETNREDTFGKVNNDTDDVLTSYLEALESINYSGRFR